MAQSYKTGNSAVTADQPITDLLSAPLSPGWTIEGLADQLLAAIAAQPKAQDLVLDAESSALLPQERDSTSVSDQYPLHWLTLEQPDKLHEFPPGA